MDTKEPGPSIIELSTAYFNSLEQPVSILPSYYFCDNEVDANECAELVLAGIKKATASSLWWYELSGEALPEVGDLSIVTNWAGEALCVIEVMNIEVTRFNAITPAFAELEGEGDKSLAYWKEVHWAFYSRELAGTKYTPSEDMPIVCEEFRLVYA